MGLFQFERCPPPDIMADIFFIDKHMMDNSPGPISATFGPDISAIKVTRNFVLGFACDKTTEYLANYCLFGFWSRLQQNPIGLNAFMFASRKLSLTLTLLIDEHTP